MKGSNLTSVLKSARELRNITTQQTTQHLSITPDRMDIFSVPNNKIYIASPTGERFHADDTSFVRNIVGPYGSGKSVLCSSEIVKRAAAMPAWYQGRRRSRWAVVRNTSGELYSTTLATWTAWYNDLGDIRKHQKPILTYEHTFNDGNGIIEIELLFLALDREDDVRKLKSLELTGAWFNELSEIPQGALAHMRGRVGRYPGVSFCPEPYWSGIIADSNPCPDDHWMYKAFVESPSKDMVLFRQPPGLIRNEHDEWVRNPDADNAKHLPHDYYEKLASGQTNEFIKVFCLGEWGAVGFGKKVYPEYNDDLHSMDDIEAIQGDPIHLGWDFGLTPACIVVQLSPRGQLRVLKEYVADGMGIRTFAESVVLPGLAKDFPYCKIGESEADPSGIQRSQIMEELSCIGDLNALGISTRGATTNDLVPRIGSVRYFLNTMIDGKPAFVISRKGAPTLRRGFTKDYCFSRIAVAGEERYRDKPDKNMSSHPHDALQYISMKFAADRIIDAKADKGPKVDMYNPVMRIF